MNFLKKTRPNLKRLKRDESGSMAIAWALSIATMFGVIAAATDLAMLYNADRRSQSIADTTALAAAIFVRDNARIPNSREEGFLGEYSANELGYDFRDWVQGGAEGVHINVAYDDHAREATVTVSGKTRPSILHVVGTETRFSSKSTVKYRETAPTDPASVVLVLDNSGSMNFADIPVDDKNNIVPGTQPRINGLKTSANGFMDFLHTTVGPQDPDGQTNAVLRTGMLAFSSEIITDRTVDMDWGIIDETDINAMQPDGATNSAPPLEDAETWLNIDEPPVHLAENGSQKPLKYLILMTDGRNTVGEDEWVARDGTQIWRRYVTGRPSPDGLSGEEENSPPEAVTTVVTPETTGERGTGRFTANCFFTNSGNFWRFYSDLGFDATGQHFGGVITCEGQEITEIFTIPAETETTFSGYEYSFGATPPAGAWEEGEFDIESNIKTREQCDILEESGVEIFTIAYALTPGTYARSQRSNGSWRSSRSTTSAEASADASGMLQYCATKPENFITAENADALNEAFERIGDTIVKEVIRIDS